MTEKINNIGEWLYKQAPIIVLLVLANVFQYSYFTGKINLTEAKLDKLSERLLECEKSKIEILKNLK